MVSQKKATRWRKYFEELLNSELPEAPVPEWDVHTFKEREMT